MTLVVDASAGFAAIVDAGPKGAAIRGIFRGEVLCAPSVFSFEVATVIRRNMMRGDLSGEIAEEAHNHLRSLRIAEMPYGSLARRAWDLRHNLTVIDGSYVALAELLDATLVTLDARLAQAPGIRCRVFVP